VDYAKRQKPVYYKCQYVNRLQEYSDEIIVMFNTSIVHHLEIQAKNSVAQLKHNTELALHHQIFLNGPFSSFVAIISIITVGGSNR
jgi:hypothetical protein